MNKLLSLALFVPLAACTIGSDTAGDDDSSGDDDSGEGPMNPTGGGNNGHITANTSWTGTVNVTKVTTVDPGVTLTIAAGTIVNITPGMGVTVQGTVDVQGTSAAPVKIASTTKDAFHTGFFVPTNGTLKMAFAEQTGGGITVTGGKVTVIDTKMSQTSGDFLVTSSGSLDVSYSAIGLEPNAGTDSTHCDMHFNGGSIKVTHSNISTSSYGLMLYGGTNVDLSSNNWFSNSIDVDTQPGVQGNVSNGWFEKGTPASGNGATITAANLATARLVTAGVNAPR